MKVNEYIRTKDGRIEQITGFMSTVFDDYVQIKHENLINKKEIVDSNLNKINLIQDGDYVNGFPVYEIVEYEDGHNSVVLGNDYKTILWTDNDINSIVTKEKFKAIEYKDKKENSNKIEKLDIKQEKNCKGNWKWKCNGYNISMPQKIMCDEINKIVDYINERWGADE